MLFADCTGSAFQKYHLVQLDAGIITQKSSGVIFSALFLPVMPTFMNTAWAAIKCKSIYCSIFVDPLLDYIGRMATKYSYSQLIQLYDYKESSLQLLENDTSRPMSRDQYFIILKNARMIKR
jgi:hypothetical protein